MTYEYNDNALGPIGEADATLLGGILNYIKPKVSVEFGSLLGHGANIISQHSGKVFCVDINPHKQLFELAKERQNITIVRGRMEDFIPPEQVDFVFFDACHELNANEAAYVNTEPHLTRHAIIAVHDTGDWPDSVSENHKSFLTGRVKHVNNEREFVRKLVASGWSAINFGTRSALRHGITLLQRSMT